MKLYNITYFLREGFSSIFSHRLMSVAAMSVIMACLLLMGSFSLVVANIENLLGDIEEKNQIVAYVDETYTEEQGRALEGSLKEVKGVSGATYTTKQEALEAFRADFEDESGILDGIDDRNPLRDRFVVTVTDIEKTREIAEALSGVEGIAKVSARSDIADRIVEVSDVTTLICTVLILVLVLVSIFIISNTVNLTMFNRREEIAIMKMIGATNGFVRVPFIVEGLIIGFAGATFALLLQWAIYDYVIVEALSKIAFISSVPFAELVWKIVIMFYGVGAIVGGLGSAITLRKFLKV